MPPRFQQQKLASAQVGTPGLDTSAGAAEAKIVEASQEARNADFQMRNRSLQQAEQSFNSAGYQFFHMQQRQATLNRAIEEEQRKLQVQLDRLDEDDRLSDLVAGLKETHASRPQDAIADLQNQLPVLRSEFQDRYGDDPKRLRMLLPSQRAAEHGALSEIENWSSKTITENLNANLNILPQRMESRIGALSGTLAQQLNGFQQSLIDIGGIYTGLRQNAVSDAARVKITDNQMTMFAKAGDQFIDHQIAQTPDGEAGMNHLDTIKSLLERSSAIKLPISPNDKESQLRHIESLRNSREQEVITGIQSDATVAKIDNENLKANLILNANDPTKLATITKEVQARMVTLDDQVKAVDQLPDSPIKKAKLVGLRQQQQSLVGELGLDLKLSRSYEQLQRTLTSFAQSQTRFEQSQTRFQQSQEDRAKRDEHGAKTATLNSQWLGITDSMNKVLSMQHGPEQQKALNPVIDLAVDILKQARVDGSISVDQYNKRLGYLKDNAHLVEGYKQSNGFFGIGAGPVKLKGKEAQKARDDADRQLAAALSNAADDIRIHQKGASTQLNALVSDKNERALIQGWLDANLPGHLGRPEFKALSPVERERNLAKYVKIATERFRKGQLK